MMSASLQILLCVCTTDSRNDTVIEVPVQQTTITGTSFVVRGGLRHNLFAEVYEGLQEGNEVTVQFLLS
jgi:hypothetical protein